MNLTVFKICHRSEEIRSRISETMKRTGELWRCYLELLPEEYHFENCKQFRTYLKRTHDSHLMELLTGGRNGKTTCSN